MSNILFSGTGLFFFFLFGSLQDLFPQPGIEPVFLAPLTMKAQSPNHWEFSRTERRNPAQPTRTPTQVSLTRKP